MSFVLVKRTPTTQGVTVRISTTDGSATSGPAYTSLSLYSLHLFLVC